MKGKLRETSGKAVIHWIYGDTRVDIPGSIPRVFMEFSLQQTWFRAPVPALGPVVKHETGRATKDGDVDVVFECF